MNLFRNSVAAATLLSLVGVGARAATIPVAEDVMTSGFFTRDNLFRGYAGDGRAVHRVSTDDPFGTEPETVYLTFDYDFAGAFAEPIASAVLSIESVSGGFGADATSENPFEMSAHALSSDPLATILDDTNSSGSLSWSDYFANEILPADAAATTVVTGFGTLGIDITAIVNDWISGANDVLAIALTGKNDTLSDGAVMHGIVNASEASALTHYVTVTPAAVPEPSAAALALLAAPLVVRFVLRRPIGRRSRERFAAAV